ncbi:MAG: helix-turn-helix domain-containing protein, partial [Paracoccaceae bacterium]
MQDSLPATLSVAFLHPFFEELFRRGAKKSELAARIGIDETSLFDPVVSVPANSVYGFLSWIAADTEDPLLCARIGQQMAMGAWAPLLPLMGSAKTVGDFFQKFSLMSSEQGRAVSYKLEVEGAVAIWRLVRAKGASNDASFADAVAAGFFVGLLKSAAQDEWETARTIAVLPDTSIVPRDLLPSTSVLSGRPGLILRFPSTYLGLEMPTILPADNLPELSVTNARETTLAERVSVLIERHISDPNLGVEGVAKGVGLASWKLQSLLKEEGMSVSRIRDEVRRRCAIEKVTETADSVSSIAARLGYTNSSNFTRAFRGWT